MIDRNHIGMQFTPHVARVEEGSLRFFAKAIGERNPIYTDVAAAKAAGYSALPAPPTYVFSLNLMKPDPFSFLADMKVDLGSVLHGEQSFEYFSPLVAGDEVTLRGEISNIYEKKNGALEFIEFQTTATNQHGEIVAKMTSVTVVRN